MGPRKMPEDIHFPPKCIWNPPSLSLSPFWPLSPLLSQLQLSLPPDAVPWGSQSNPFRNIDQRRLLPCFKSFSGFLWFLEDHPHSVPSLQTPSPLGLAPALFAWLAFPYAAATGTSFLLQEPPVPPPGQTSCHSPAAPLADWFRLTSQLSMPMSTPLNCPPCGPI